MSSWRFGEELHQCVRGGAAVDDDALAILDQAGRARAMARFCGTPMSWLNWNGMPARCGFMARSQRLGAAADAPDLAALGHAR